MGTQAARRPVPVRPEPVTAAPRPVPASAGRPLAPRPAPRAPYRRGGLDTLRLARARGAASPTPAPPPVFCSPPRARRRLPRFETGPHIARVMPLRPGPWPDTPLHSREQTGGTGGGAR